MALMSLSSLRPSPLSDAVHGGLELHCGVGDVGCGRQALVEGRVIRIEMILTIVHVEEKQCGTENAALRDTRLHRLR